MKVKKNVESLVSVTILGLLLGLLSGVLTGCGFNASIYPVTQASHHTSYEAHKVHCLWGNCDIAEVK